jgi:hypothetical protein
VIARGFYKRVFAGIKLSRERAKSAERIVRGSVSVALAMPRTHSELMEIQARRDSLLRALVTNDADRRRFDANLRAQERGP